MRNSFLLLLGPGYVAPKKCACNEINKKLPCLDNCGPRCRPVFCPAICIEPPSDGQCVCKDGFVREPSISDQCFPRELCNFLQLPESPVINPASDQTPEP